MSANVQRTDLFVGVFLVTMVALVIAAFVATSGWGTDRYEIYVRTASAQDLTIDTRIFLQGLEVGRITAINPRPTGRAAGQLEFIVRLSLLDRFPDGTPLRLPRSTDAEVVQSGVLGGSQLQLSVQADSGVTGGTLAPGDTIELRRGGSALDAFGSLARDLKGTIEATLLATTATLNSVRVLAESLAVATGTARRFIVSVQPETEKILSGVTVNLDRVRLLLDSTTVRTGVSMRQLDSTLAQSRVLIRSLDSLTAVFIAMGGENRPEIAAMIQSFRQLSVQLQYVLDQVGRRPMRAITGVHIPDSITPAGMARRQIGTQDSARAAAATRDSAAARRDSTRAQPPAAPPPAAADTSRPPPPADTTRRPPPDTRHPSPGTRP